MDRTNQGELQTKLHGHLARWGLRRFTSDDAYFEWQRQVLSPQEISSLHERVEKKRCGASFEEIAFYDAAAHPRILPVLFSQRYDYYLAIGPRVAARIADARTVLDFGCGVGILTIFYAKQFPAISFVGIDRSPVSIAQAQKQAEASGLTNLRFDCGDIFGGVPPGSFDLIIATHALLQAEQDPGLPSRDWTTFDRQPDEQQQRLFEERTGIGPRLDRLSALIAPGGRLILFEKTRQLARRVPFQRALAARRLSLIEPPEPVRYQQVGKTADDGPLYVLQSGTGRGIVWDEQPEPDEGHVFDPHSVALKAQAANEPLYENHHPSAQQAWQRLRARSVINEQTRSGPDGRQWHAELGTAEDFVYLYCANTFDQRQLVIVDPPRSKILESYYRDILGERREG